MHRDTAHLLLAGGGAALLGGLLWLGCQSSSSENQPLGAAGTIGSATNIFAAGPAHVGGLPLQSGATDDDTDIVLANSRLTAVVDRPGLDPASPGGAFPRQNLLAPSMGALVDLYASGSGDQWNQMTQGVVGFVTVAQGTTGSADADPTQQQDLFFDFGASFSQTLVAPSTAAVTSSNAMLNGFATLFDATEDFAAAGVRTGDVVTFLTGANAGNSFAVTARVNANLLQLTVDPAGPALADDAAAMYQVTRPIVREGDVLTITSGQNAGRQYQVGAAGFLEVGNGNTLALFRPQGFPYEDEGPAPPNPGSISYTVTRRTSPLENLVVYDAADLFNPQGDPAIVRCTGGILNQGAVPDGAGVAATTSRLTVGGTEIEVQTDYKLFRDADYVTVETTFTNPGGGDVALTQVADLIVTGGFDQARLATWTPLTGFMAQGLDSPVIVPFSSYRGRGRPGASFTHVDAQVGQTIHAADGQLIAANIQLSTATETASGESVTWARRLVVGDRNDVASSANTAVGLLGNSPARVNPAAGTTLPNMYEGVFQIAGQVVGAPPGTTITAIQVEPGLTFDAGAPNGLTLAPGFYPSTIFGAAELLISQARPDAQGRFSISVPAGFAGLAPAATAAQDLFITPPFETGQAAATYRILVEAPGHDPQSVLVRGPGGALNNLLFDLTNETGAIDITVTDPAGEPIPCTVWVRGMDPDGIGPGPATPDPVFGANAADTGDAFAAGDGTNRVRLIDGRATLPVAPGTYQVVAGRGLEYNLATFPPAPEAVDHFNVAAGQTVATIDSQSDPIVLTRLLDDADLPTPGGGGTFESPLRRYVAADLRFGTDRSFGQPTPAEDRLTAYAATGVEVVVATDQDVLGDLSPALAELEAATTPDLADILRVQRGREVTPLLPTVVPDPAFPGGLILPNTAGSSCGWPQTDEPDLRRDGAFADEFRDPAVVFESLRGTGATVVQLNAPRAPIADAPLPPIGIGWFTNGKAGFPQPNRGTGSLTAGGYATPLRSDTPVPGAGNDDGLGDLNAVGTPSGTRRNDFDLLETYAGVDQLYDLTRLDAYALTSAGYVRTQTASGDLSNEPGFPRTYVFAAGDASADLSGLDLTAFNDTLLPSLVQSTPGTTVPGSAAFFPASRRNGAGADAMDVLGSSGPVVFVEVDADQDGAFEGQPGDLISDDGNPLADIRVTVLAAPWVPVDEGTVIVNGSGAASGLTGLPAPPDPIVAIVLTGDLEPNPTDPFSTDLEDCVRLRMTYTIPLAEPVPAVPGLGDHWIVADVRGTPPAGSLLSGLVAPGLMGDAVGFSNPVFVDTNDDGDWDPNGVP